MTGGDRAEERMGARPATAIDHRLIILLVGLTQLVITTDFSTISVSLPSIGRGFALLPASLAWVISAAALPFAGFLILAGRAADMFGQRRCMLTGLGLFGAGSLAAALAPSFPALLAARALQGLGGAILTPANFSLINTLVPEGPARHRALGVFGVMQGLSLVIGLLAGGWLTTRFDWRAVFLINPPIIAAAIALTVKAVPRGLPRGNRGLDIAGAALITAGTAAVLSGVSWLGRGGVSAPALGLLAGGVAAFAAFFVVEARVAAPLVPLSIFGRRNFAVGAMVGGCHLAGVGGLFVLTSLYMQLGLKFSPLASGLGMMPYAAAVMLAGQVAPPIMARFPHRAIVFAGFGFYVAGLTLLALFSGSGSYGVALAPWSVIAAFGSTLSFMALMAEATADVPAEQQGVASAVLFTVQQIGVPLGAALALSVLGVAGRSGFGAGYIAIGAVVAAGMAIGLLGLRATPKEPPVRDPSAGVRGAVGQ